MWFGGPGLFPAGPDLLDRNRLLLLHHQFAVLHFHVPDKLRQL